jgi:hypothetical protein
MRQRDLIPFFAMAFLIAWGILALYMFASETMARLFGSLTGQHPLFYLAVYAPAIAALTLVLYRHGIDGTRRFLSRLLLVAGVDPVVYPSDRRRAVSVLCSGPGQRGRLRHAVSISISADLPGGAAADGNQGANRGNWLARIWRCHCCSAVWHPYGLRWCWVSSGRSGIFRPFCSAAHRKAPGR